MAKVVEPKARKELKKGLVAIWIKQQKGFVLELQTITESVIIFKLFRRLYWIIWRSMTGSISS